MKITSLAEKLQDKWLKVATRLPRREPATALHKGHKAPTVEPSVQSVPEKPSV